MDLDKSGKFPNFQGELHKQNCKNDPIQHIFVKSMYSTPQYQKDQLGLIFLLGPQHPPSWYFSLILKFKILGLRNFVVPTKPKVFFWPKFCLTQKFFNPFLLSAKMFFWSIIVLDTKLFFGPNFFLADLLRPWTSADLENF